MQLFPNIYQRDIHPIALIIDCICNAICLFLWLWVKQAKYGEWKIHAIYIKPPFHYLPLCITLLIYIPKRYTHDCTFSWFYLQCNLPISIITFKTCKIWWVKNAWNIYKTSFPSLTTFHNSSHIYTKGIYARLPF